MLQGQFRDSDHVLMRSQIEKTLISTTVGITREFPDNLRISFFVSRATPEIKGVNARSLWWAGLVVNRPW